MSRRSLRMTSPLVVLGTLMLTLSAPAAEPDFDATGYVDLTDYFIFEICFSLSGPEQQSQFTECRTAFDANADADVDLADFASFQRLQGHRPIPLKDALGNAITIDSTAPYSPRQTCGSCHEHEADVVGNGEWFQQGRTNLAGIVDMKDDYYNDGRWWIKSAGRYGKWGQSFQFMLASKENTSASQIDQTAFMWAKECSTCHSGGGPTEFDRDAQKFYDKATGQFGYEKLGKTIADVDLSGDYSMINRATGEAGVAPWDRTGVGEADCLLCHRDMRPTVNGADMVRGWRATVLGAGENLVDNNGQPVPAFEAAATAGQGWFCNLATAGTVAGNTHDGSLTGADLSFLGLDVPQSSVAAAGPTLQINYAVGLGDGSLMQGENDEMLLRPEAVAKRTLDVACVSCHPLAVVTGTVWFDTSNIHYRKFTNHNDDDPLNDIPPDRATVCTECHPTGLDHNAAKGNSFQLQYRDELDWVGFRTCRDCHLTRFPDGTPNPNKHPDSPDVPGDLEIHNIGFNEGELGPMHTMSCQACHIPYALTAGVLFRDITIPGNVGSTPQYLSADPLDPTNADKSKWYPPLRWKKDSDGVMRLFPANVWIMIYFGDWNDNGTPGDLSDDIVAPIYTWRVASVIGNQPLPGTTDDDGDGRIEIDRPAELLAYFAALKGNDYNGVPVATRPVLVRGPRVWYEDPESPTGVNSFEHEGTGIPMTSYPYIWGMDHNVRPQAEAWGAGGSPDGCQDCHAPAGESPVFDRLVLVDPHGPGREPEYTTVREQTGVTFHNGIKLRGYDGEPLRPDSTKPYSGRQTCGGVACHDVDRISNGLTFQEGRTDPDRNIIMHDDVYNDGRWWIRGTGMYGRSSPGGGGLNRQTAGKDNVNASRIDMTAFYWAGDCGGCHTGGGGVEFDRDGNRYWDVNTGLFGYETAGRSPEDVTLDGDYAYLDPVDSTLSLAPWDVTGVADPECLHCHRADRTWVGGGDGMDMQREWRAQVLSARDTLVDTSGSLVPAYASAGTAGQGWFSVLDIGGPGPNVLQLDYTVGLNEGSLSIDTDGTLLFNATSLARPPRDQACWGCHLPGGFEAKRGTVWFDTQDIHYRKFTNQNDEDPTNDIPVEEATVCNTCHPNDLDHNFAKGNSPYAQFRNELDWAGDFRSCRECHLYSSPVRHPDAPEVLGPNDIVTVHTASTEDSGPMATLACQTCHVPRALREANIVTDRSVTGTAIQYKTSQFLSAKQNDPTDPDKSSWAPALMPKLDTDGRIRYFPQKLEVSIFWGDWNQNGTPEDLSDDTVQPIILWRVREITGNQALPAVTDDNGDGILEVNRPEEILAYIQALKGNDSFGRPVALNPVLVKGPNVWYEDPGSPTGVSTFPSEGAGPFIRPYEIFGLDHNVLAKENAWGAGALEDGHSCNDCHGPVGTSQVIDRAVLLDPFDVDGEPVYATVRQMHGLNPP